MQNPISGEIDPAFEDSPDLRHLVAYWRSKFRGAEIPSRDDIDPVDLKRHLNYLYIAEPLDDKADFRFRLTGTGLNNIQDRELTGLTMREAFWGFSKPVLEALINDYQIVMSKKQVMRVRGSLLWAGRDELKFDAVHLPIASPDGKSVWIFGKFMATDLPPEPIARRL